jgi:exopolysaccharide biosynthesis polyprenyl glycosylphosphotransferase
MEYDCRQQAASKMSSEKPTRPRRIHLRPSEQRWLLLFGDAVVALLALYGALYYWSIKDPQFAFSLAFLLQRVPGWFYFFPLGWLIMMVDLYDLRRAANWRDTLRGVAVAALLGLAVYAVIYLISPKGSLPRQGVGAYLILVSTLTLAWRLLYIRFYTDPAFMRRILIAGAGAQGQTLVTAYKSIWPPPFYLVGLIDDDPDKEGTLVEGYPVLGGSELILEIVERETITDVIVAIQGEIYGGTFQTLLDAQERGLDILRMPPVYEELLGRIPIKHLETDWIIRSFVDEARTRGLYEIFKRLVDVLGALVGMLILAVLVPFIALAVLLGSGWPVFYTQVRLGRGARPHRIYKFRTMRNDAESDGHARPAAKNDPRITRVGRFLRKTRLDELPQFINVLRGEMSLVGPRSERPELVKHYERQVPFYRSRLLVKPGMTGWAQVNFGYAATVEDTVTKLEYDLYYIKHRSVGLDLLIMLRTIGTVFRFRGR